MVHTCVVSGCRNRRTPGTSLSFYRFPRDPDRKQRWINAVNREGWIPNDGSRLCSTHFISGNTVVLLQYYLLTSSQVILQYYCSTQFISGNTAVLL
uniref:THAP domain-containing protein 1 n=1 Tax=Amphiprion ocellaris TaxID=80972 RepID=A0A3Q1B0Z3_AMPOC